LITTFMKILCTRRFLKRTYLYR